MKIRSLHKTDKADSTFRTNVLTSVVLSLASTFFLAACATQPNQSTSTDVDQKLWSSVLKSLSPGQLVNPTESTHRAITALKEAGSGNLPAASKGLNQALQLEPGSASLHFFNGFVYHLWARNGDTEKISLAIEGYRQAVRFDPSYWIAHEFLGLAYLEQKQYKAAQRSFAEALILRPDDTRLQERLMVASYLAGDPQTACGMADQLGAVSSQDKALLRSAVSVYASCSRFDQADRIISFLSASYPEAVDDVKKRLNQWQMFHKQRPVSASLIKTQYGGIGGFGGANMAGPQFPQMPQSGLGGSSGFGGMGHGQI